MGDDFIESTEMVAGLVTTYFERNLSGRDRRNWDTTLGSNTLATPVASDTALALIPGARVRLHVRALIRC